MKRVFAILLLSFFVVSSFAQASEGDVKSKKQSQIGYNHDFRISAGLPFGVDIYRHIGSESRTYCAPSLTFGYKMRVVKGLFLGVSVSYNNYLATSPFTGVVESENQYRVQQWQPMFDIKYQWYNRGLVTLYSEVGLGASINGAQHTAAVFAWGVTPIGITVGGKHWYGAAEVNWSAKGLFVLGVGYRF